MEDNNSKKFVIGGIYIRKIVIHSWFNFAEHDYPYETYEFVINFKKKKASFKPKKIYDHCIYYMANEENQKAYHKIHSYYSEEIFPLKNFDMSKIKSSINRLRKWREKNQPIDTNLNRMVFYHIDITYQNKEEERLEIYNEFPLELLSFANLLKSLVGFDVFNFDNLSCLVTEHNYDISSKQICDKATGEELILKRMDYSKACGALFKATTNSFNINFEKKELITYEKERIKLTSDDIEKIIFLIKKYGVFKWNSLEYSNKAINEPVYVLDGCRWRLSLAFEGRQVLNFGGRHNYPDTYADFGKELIDLFGIDLLSISEME